MTKANWKTNTLGIIACLISIGVVWSPNDVVKKKLQDTQSQITVLAGILGIGLLASRDHDNK